MVQTKFGNIRAIDDKNRFVIAYRHSGANAVKFCDNITGIVISALPPGGVGMPNVAFQHNKDTRSGVLVASVAALLRHCVT